MFNKKQILFFVGLATTVLCFGIYFVAINRKKDEMIFTSRINTPASETEDEPELDTKTEYAETPLLAEPTIEPIKMIKVHIIGEVVNQGVFELPEGSRINDVIEAAGGLSEDANPESVNLAQFIHDEQQIRIYKTGDDYPEEQINTTSVPSSPPLQVIETANNELININTASKEILMQLPGIGTTIADNIINYRTNNGLFKNIEDIKNVSRIGDKIFDGFKHMITVD